MLRVLSVGLSLPQNPCTVLLLFPVPTWDPPLHSMGIFQVRRVSDFALKFPEPPEPEKVASDTDEKGKGEEEPPRRVVHRNPWVKTLLHQELLRKPIRRLRPLRPPPKYSSTPDLQKASTPRKEPVLRADVHPFHRVQIPMEDDSIPKPLREILLNSSLSPSVAQYVAPSVKRGRSALLRVLEKTRSIPEAWEAYEALLKLPRLPDLKKGKSRAHQVPPLTIPYEYLHRFARLLSTAQPRTRSLYLRLLSVLTTLRQTGGNIFVWEWNALVDCAGKGWRKTTMQDYRAALGIFKDMVVLAQKTTLTPPLSIGKGNDALVDNRPVAQPDIITFTTLLDIASRSVSKNALTHATSLLEASELPWNIVTHKMKLRYFIRHRQLSSVLDILRDAVDRGLELSMLNACLWAYARWGQLRVVMEVYELLRRNIPPEYRVDFEKSDSARSFEESGHKENPILNALGCTLPNTMCPDRVTYTLLIQAMSYHGDFISAVKVFRDMISTADFTALDDHPVGRPAVPRLYKPSLAVYRSFFLGFVRHGQKTLTSTLISKRRSIDVVPLPEFAANLTASDPGTPSSSSDQEQREAPAHWTLDNLETLFKSFLEIGWDSRSAPDNSERPSDRMIYWIMVAYAQATERDIGKMYQVWRDLNVHFGYSANGVNLWSGRIVRFGEEIEKMYRKHGVVQHNSLDMDEM